MFVVPKKIGAALDGRGRLYHFCLDIRGVRLMFAGTVIPIDRLCEMVGVGTRNNQLSDGSVPLCLAVRNANLKIGDGQEHITRLGVGRFPARVGKAPGRIASTNQY